MRRLLNVLWLCVGLLAFAALVIALSFPFLAVNEPVGARVAVVEGWIDVAHMAGVERLLNEGGYERVYITGTPRNFSYTLRMGDTIVVDLKQPTTGQLTVNACGSRPAQIHVLSSTGMLLKDSLNDDCHDRQVGIGEAIQQLRFTVGHPGFPDPTWELLFLLYVKIDGVNLHALQRKVTIQRDDGRIVSGTPSYADVAAGALMDAGFPAERIEPLPTVMLGESRTWANAQRFAQEARQKGIDKVDVISFGIHARRSRVAFSTACGSGVEVGIRCIEDPELQRGRWWRSTLGWLKVIREMVGIPASYLVAEKENAQQ